MDGFEFDRFDALTFDCYGTLIDWERGILDGLRPVFAAHAVEADDEALLRAYAAVESELEAGPYLTYRSVLGEALRRLARQHGFDPTGAEVDGFGGSVERWPAFPDSAAALARLRTRFRLGVITNCDDDLFAFSSRRLGDPFDWVITAQQAGGYKPRIRNFELAFERIGLPRERILHVAQSLFHDHVPAKRLGMTSVWIDRRHDRPGFGATPAADAAPDLVFPDMASFAEAAVGPAED